MVDRTVTRETEATEDKISFEEFLRLYDGQHAEWVDGAIELMSPVSENHDGLVFFLRSLLTSFLDEQPLGRIRQEPFTMKLAGQARGRSPDLLFVTNAHLSRLKPNVLDGPADLVVEVVSPESVDRDYKTKFGEYEKGGIPEYLIIDPIKPQVKLHRLGSDKRYHEIVPDANGDLQFQVLPSFRLHIETLWQNPLPNMVQTIQIA